MTELGPKGTAGGGYQLWLRGQTEQHGGSGLQQVWEQPRREGGVTGTGPEAADQRCGLHLNVLLRI